VSRWANELFASIATTEDKNAPENFELLQKKLKKRFPLVDKFFPLNSFEKILEHINIIENTNTNNVKINDLERKIINNTHSAYLKIADGCNRTCAFCTIPSIKGSYYSISPIKLLEEANVLAEQGIKELVLIAQETSLYGMELNNKEYNFAYLLENLSQIEKLKWIRIMYSHPNSFDERILDVMKEHQNICKYIDIPLQHISDNMLTAMNRFTPSDNIKILIDKMRKKIPDIHIRSTFIVGFPGETQQDNKLLYDFLKEYELDRVGIFPYSPEKGTVSFDLPNRIPESVKIERFCKLMELQQNISKNKNKKLIGSEIEVLIEKASKKGQYEGRTEFDAPDIDNGVIIYSRFMRDRKIKNYVKYNNKDNHQKKIEIGDFVKLKVIDCTAYDLICEI
jgi:ribosomal protein S12 methylthiotransferase